MTTFASLAYVQTRVDPLRDIIYVNGNRLPKKLPPKVYLALNKPKGFVTVTKYILFHIVFLSLLLMQDWKLFLWFRNLMQFYCGRYICSSGEKKSVMCLVDDYLRSWVCDVLNFGSTAFCLLS